MIKTHDSSGTLHRSHSRLLRIATRMPICPHGQGTGSGISAIDEEAGSCSGSPAGSWWTATNVSRPLCSRDTSRATCAGARCESTSTATVPRPAALPSVLTAMHFTRNFANPGYRTGMALLRRHDAALQGGGVTHRRQGGHRGRVPVDDVTAAVAEAVPVHRAHDLAVGRDKGLHLLDEPRLAGAGCGIDPPFGDEHGQAAVCGGEAHDRAEQVRRAWVAERGVLQAQMAGVAVVTIGGDRVDFPRAGPELARPGGGRYVGGARAVGVVHENQHPVQPSPLVPVKMLADGELMNVVPGLIELCRGTQRQVSRVIGLVLEVDVDRTEVV